AHRAFSDRQCEALQERKVAVHVEPLGLVAGKATGDGLELFTNGFEIVQTLLQTEVLEVIGAQLVAQERAELLVLFEERVLEVGKINMMPGLDLIDDGGKFARHSLV